MVVTKKKPKKPGKPNESKIGRKLTPKQELFCQLYVNNKLLFGNATLCYAQAYAYKLDSLSTEAIYREEFDEETEQAKNIKVDDSPYDKAYRVCQVTSSQLLSNPIINDRINDLLYEMMSEKNVDTELTWLMNQRTELGPKVQAIREFNKLKGRIKGKGELEIKSLNLKALYDLANSDDDDDDE